MPIFNSFNSGSSRRFGFSKGIVLKPPTGISSIAGETSVTVSFTAPSGDTPSNIEYRLSTNGGSTYGSWIALSPPDITSPITISGLTSNEAYSAQLRTTLLGQFSEPSTSFNFQTLAAAPSGLSASSITSSSFVLSFSQATGGGETISNYKYALSTNGGSSYGAYTALSPADATSPVTISGLSSGTAYVVKIRAVTAAGDGSESTTASFTTLPSTFSVQYLVIGGGGSGGYVGGGGAGAYRCSVSGETSGGGASAESPLSLTSGTYTVTVGGAGSSSAFSTITSSAGGGGANAGGSAGNGYGGGNSRITGPEYAGGGGGGAGSGGGNASFENRGGNGGSGLTSSITGSGVTRAGGGGGGCRNGDIFGSFAGGSGGSGGGGRGAFYTNQGSTAGGANTGSGGGGGSHEGPGPSAGGSGIVIVRYLTSSASAFTVTGGTKTTSGSYTIHTFTGTSSLVVS